jgi:hypothetical protein
MHFKALAAISDTIDGVRELNMPLLGTQFATVRLASPELGTCSSPQSQVDGREYGRGSGNRESQAMECAARNAYQVYRTYG